MTLHDDLWTDFTSRAQRLSLESEPRDAIDRTILWQLQGVEPFCREPLTLDDLHLPELHSGAPWRTSANRPRAIGDRWVAFVALNPSLSEDESFPTLGDLTAHGAEALQGFFDERFAARYVGRPRRRGRHRGAVRTFDRRTGRPRAVRTWSVLDNLTGEALEGHGVEAPLGDVAAIIDAVPYKFRRWSAVPTDLRDELMAHAAPRLSAVLSRLRPTLVVLLGVDTHGLAQRLKPVAGGDGEVHHGVRHLGRRRLGETGPEAEVLAAYHPTSIAWSSAGSRGYLTTVLRAHLLDEAGR